MSLSQVLGWTQRTILQSTIFGWLPSQHEVQVGTETIYFSSLGLAVLDEI